MQEPMDTDVNAEGPDGTAPLFVSTPPAGAFGRPLAFYAFAQRYLEAADALPPPLERFFPVPHHLYRHAIELALKAYLRAKHVPGDEIKRRIRHNVVEAMNRARKLGLDSVYTITPPQRAAIRQAYDYEEKLRHCDIVTAMTGYKGLPEIDVLADLARGLVPALKETVFKALHELLPTDPAPPAPQDA